MLVVSGRKFIWSSFLILAPFEEAVNAIPFLKPHFAHTRTHTCKAEVLKGVAGQSHPSSGALVKVFFLLLAPPRRLNTVKESMCILLV